MVGIELIHDGLSTDKKGRVQQEKDLKSILYTSKYHIMMMKY